MIVKLISITLGKSWQSSEVPTGWKRGNITSIFKKSKKEDPGNYRIVSLTSVPARQDHGADPPRKCAQAHGR